MHILISSFFCIIFVMVLAVHSGNARIICPSGDNNRLQQRSLCRQRFAELKNTPAYRSMLQAIADRRLPIAGSIASFQLPPPLISSSSSSSPSSSFFNQQQQNPQISSDETVNINRPLTTYQDIMHNLLMKMS